MIEKVCKRLTRGAKEQSGELVEVFKKIWSDTWGARMEDI